MNIKGRYPGCVLDSEYVTVSDNMSCNIWYSAMDIATIGGSTARRVRKPTMIKSEQMTSIHIISINEVSLSILSIEGNV